MNDELQKVLSTIDNLKSELDSLSPIKKEYEDKLWEKFRLEWNYNSNHIEGNTLTYGETELLLRLGDEFKAQNNSLKDVNEMRAHDTAIFLIRDWATEKNRSLQEKDIRELNKLILVKNYWADAQTTLGQPTRREIKVGEYKSHPNHVRLKSGKLFKYAEPNEVPAKMNDLITWYNASREDHPLIVSSFLHYKFVIIHPFDDGNGRVSRLLMNYHLLQLGYPPIIIKSEDKKNYLYALNQADAGDTEAFMIYLGTQLIWSLEIAVKSAKGESIVEKDDLYKEIEVWKKQLKSELPTTPKRRDDIIAKLYDNSWHNLFESIIEKTKTFEELFLNFSCDIKSMRDIGEHNLTLETVSGYLSEVGKNESDSIRRLELSIKFDTPLNDPNAKNKIFDTRLNIKFDVFNYMFYIPHTTLDISKKYDELITTPEMDNIIETLLRKIFDEIKNA